MSEQERFRRLARSSPWLWSSVRLRFDDGESDPVRAWIRRPDALRVEDLSGRLLAAHPGRPSPDNVSVFLVADADGVVGETPAPPTPLWWTDPRAPRPPLDAEGLVADPERLPIALVIDDPMWQNYRWVAMLAPRELADDDDGGPAVEIDSVETGVRHGRATIWATVRPRDGYDPRCSCCPLLPSRPAALAQGYPDPDGPFASAHRVALDVATGICVSTRELGGPTPDRGFEVVIEAVDEVFPDELFVSFPTSSTPRWWPLLARVTGAVRRRRRPVPGIAP